MSAPTWSRRPFVGSLPKAFRSTLAAGEALDGLRALLASPDVEGSVDGQTAWLAPRGGLRPPAVVLRLRIVHDPDGAKIEGRFDASRWDSADLWVYVVVAAVGFEVAGAWFAGRLPGVGRGVLTAAAPVAIAALAALSTAHYAFRRWRRAVRERLFDRAMIALGVPIA